MSALPQRVSAPEAEIERLANLDIEALRTRWRSESGRAAPAHLPKGLLVRLLAYRIQANIFGDLDPATQRFLQQVASQRGEGPSGSIPLPDGERVRPGAVLVREWNGVTHRVMALADGFAWNGQTYASLSEVARAITGTRWNGPRFFGLRGREETNDGKEVKGKQKVFSHSSQPPAIGFSQEGRRVAPGRTSARARV